MLTDLTKTKTTDQNKNKTKQKNTVTDVHFGRKRLRLTITRNRQRQTPDTIRRWVLGVIFVLMISPLLGVVYTYTRGGESARVHAATSSTLNFQARLQNASGSLVADGSYSVQFKLYDAVSAGTNEWTETETVTVKNGYLSANLGSVTPFSSTIDWSQEKWLTMNVNGDGEMNPRIKLTGVPFAFRAGLADKLSITGGSLLGDDILQKAPGSVQSVSSTNSGLRFNQTGSGGLVQLQGNGLDVFTVSKSGLIGANGLNNNSGGITNAGAISGATTFGLSGAISGATATDTINGLIINAGSLSGITGFSQTSGTFSLTGTGGITIGGGSNALSIDSTAFDVSSSGALSGITTIAASGAITAATSTNTINGLVINAGAISSVTGITFASGNLAMGGGNITGVGANITGNGALTISSAAATALTLDSGTTGTVNLGISNNAKTLNIATGTAGDTINIATDNTVTDSINIGSANDTLTINSSAFKASSAGALSGITTLALSGAITGATATNTINGLIINAGSLSGITGFSQTSGAFSVTGTGGITLGGGSNALTINSTAFDVTSAGAVSGVTTLSLSGAITGATATNTINGLVINSGALSSVTGITFTSGNLAMGGGSITGVGTNITANGALTITSGAASILTIDSGTTGTVNLATSNNAKTLNLVTGTAGDTINIATDNTVTDIINIGSANDTLTINSSAFKLSSAGALSGVTTLSLSGAITGATATNTINGLIINSGSLSGITGFSQTSGAFSISGTGAITLGAGSNSFSIASTGFDVTAAGAVSGVTTLNASGLIDSTTGFSKSGVAGQTFTCGTGTYINAAVVAGGIITGHSACTSAGLSDQRLKTNILTMGSVLDKIKDVNVVTFDFDCNNSYFEATDTYCDPSHQTGVIAQQLATVFPELTYQDAYGINHVKYDALAMYDFKATSELSQKLDSQGNASLNTVSTGGALRLTQTGSLQNINGLTMTSGGASIMGGLNNNNGGITSVGNLSGVTGINAESITLNANTADDMLHLTKDGNNVFTVFNTGALQLQLDSPQALAVKAANGDNALTVDTLSGKIRIGSGNSGKTFLFVLDNKSTAGDPEGTNGAQYYNSDSNKFRCYQNNEWQDCVQTSYSEYTVMSTPGPWVQPSGEMEFPVQNRTWIEFRNANQFRILANLTTAGATNSVCRMQYATNTDSGSPDWHNLSTASDGGPIHLNSTGALKSEWTPVVKEAKKENLIRVYCGGGDMQTAPNFTSIRIQVR